MNYENYSKEELIAEINNLKSQQNKYGLSWDKTKIDNGALLLKDNVPNLIHNSEKDIMSPNVSPEQEHLLINGDNIYSLTALQKNYLGKIDVIYIDPPYNTGTKDFVYNDNFVEKNDPDLHSKWLCFMENRLKLAKELLSNTGTIFISIDDHEQANLKLLCDQIFGEKNFISNLIVIGNPAGRSQDKYIATEHEYLLIYSKKPLASGSLSFEKSDEKIKKEYPFQDSKGSFRYTGLVNGHKEFDKTNRPNLYFPVYIDSTQTEQSDVNEIQTSVFTTAVYPENTSVWTWGFEKVKNEKNKLVAKKQKDGSWKIFRKVYSKDENGNNVKEKPKSVWNDSKFYTKNGQKELLEIFPGTDKRDFPHPKPMNYIKNIINTNSNKNCIVLDFFAGSGTTGHAVMELNKEDGGNRKCILCQWADKNDICDSITYKKIQTLTTGIRDNKTIYGNGYNCNWQYYTVELSPKTIK